MNPNRVAAAFSAVGLALCFATAQLAPEPDAPAEEMELLPDMYSAAFITDDAGIVKLGPDAYPRSRDKIGRTMLHFAAMEATGGASFMSAERTRVLVEAGIDPDAADRDGRTALMTAAVMCNGPAAEALLRGRAKAGLQDQDGWSALMYACAAGDWFATRARLPMFSVGLPEAADGKEKRVPDEYVTGMALFALGPSTAVIDVLLKSGVPIDQQTKDGWTALMIAASAGWISEERTAPRPVVVHAADINLIEKEISAEGGSREMRNDVFRGKAFAVYKVRMLIDAGANMELKNGDGMTALDIARSRKDAAGKLLVETLENAVKTPGRAPATAKP